MLLSQELSTEGPIEMVGKRFTEVRRPGAGPVGLRAGLVSGAGPVKEVEATGEAGPVELEAGLLKASCLVDSPLHIYPGMHLPRFWGTHRTASTF